MIRSFVIIGAVCALTPAIACDDGYPGLAARDPGKEVAEAIDRQTMERKFSDAENRYQMQKQVDAIDRQTDAILLDSVANQYPRY